MSSMSCRAILLSWTLTGFSSGIVLQPGLRPAIPNVTISDGVHWQELRNSQDLQYFGDIKVGKQTIAGVFDTGSFELLVFGEECQTCGKAVGYHHSESHSFVSGNHIETHSFGSGTCHSRDAFEKVQVGPFNAEAFPFWEVESAQMPVLRQANFQAIVGIGPPGEPVSTAEGAVEDFDAEAADYMKAYGALTPKMKEERKELLDKVELAKGKLSLLETLGVTSFSVCLGKATGSSGWLVWNDASSKTMNTFQTFPVAGSITWSLQVTSMAFLGQAGDRSVIGCQEGCGAIIDTGTSLFSLPTKMYRSIYGLLQSQGHDCRDMRKLPDLVMTVGGQELRFGPDSYIGEMTGTASEEVEKYLHMDHKLDAEDGAPPGEAARGPVVQLRQNRTRGEELRKRNQCQLLLMDLGDEVTQLGPLMILGMPFFREYYTTFTLPVGEKGHRELAVAHTDEQCRPRASPSFRTRRAEPRSVDASGLVPPRLPRRAGKKALAPLGV